MPTEPPNPRTGGVSPDPEPHQYRQVAESFGEDAERYDRTRPPYPNALVEAIVAASPGPDVLDVGAGTGVEARQFQAAGCRVLGVEPDTRMAAFARRTGVEVEVATFEAWEAAGRRFDAVIAGTAWHRVDPVTGAAKAAQVLRPSGLLAPFHHVFQYPPEVLDALATAYRQVAPDSPVNLQSLRQALDAYRRCSPRSPTGSARRAPSANPNSGSSAGSAPTPGTNGWTSCPRTTASTCSRRISWRRS